MKLSRLEAVALIVGLFVSLQPSYIHPDEHFQSLEILALQFLGVNGTIPWEFQPQAAARSFVPLFINFGPLFYLFKIGKVENPLVILSLVRMQNYLAYIVVSRYVLKRLGGTGAFSSRWCSFFIATSYLTGCFQSHSFSNSFETIIFLIVLALFNELLPHVRSYRTPVYRIACFLGFFITLGTFNRITFPAFILFPSTFVFWLFFRCQKRALALLLVSAVVSSLAFIALDTRVYQNGELTIAPLRNLLYNLDEANLEKHGLHPRYQHILFNVPQIIGPAILLINAKRSSYANDTKKLIVLAITSGLLFLSLFKHQELRFLIPLAPLLFSCLDPINSIVSAHSAFILKLWLVFNVVLAAVYGVYHQSGVLKVLNKFHQEAESIDVHVWWKTYSPPTWMYMNSNLVVSTTAFQQSIETVDQISFEVTNNHVVDLKGCSEELLNSTLQRFLENGANVKLIAPNSLANRLEKLQRISSLELTVSDQISGHLDLDHLDFDEFSTFKPGISTYSVHLSE